MRSENTTPIYGTPIGLPFVSDYADVSQDYDPLLSALSPRAQSGVAVAEAINDALYNRVYGHDSVRMIEYSHKAAEGINNVGDALDKIFNSGDESVVVDQDYNPSSANAQSGKAVAFAVQLGLDSFEHDGVNIMYYPVPDNSEPPMPIRTMLDKVWAHDAALGDIETALNRIIARQESLIGGAE